MVHAAKAAGSAVPKVLYTIPTGQNPTGKHFRAPVLLNPSDLLLSILLVVSVHVGAGKAEFEDPYADDAGPVSKLGSKTAHIMKCRMFMM